MKTTKLQTICSMVWYTDFTKPFFTLKMSYGFMVHTHTHTHTHTARHFSNLASLPGTIQMFVPVSPHQIPDITTLFITLHSQSVMFVTPDIRLSSWHLTTFLIQISFLFPSFAVPTWHLISAPNGDSNTHMHAHKHTHTTQRVPKTHYTKGK